MTTERERLTPGELSAVLSHYDLGAIESAREYARGSRQSPKFLVQTSRGRYLLKRRAPGRDRPERVAFAHALLNRLRSRRFPAPTLVRPRDASEFHVRYNGRVYEVFEYAMGERYDGSLEQTYSAGRMVARFHATVGGLKTGWRPPSRSFHDSASVRHGLNMIPTTTSSHDSVIGREAELLSMTQELYERYEDAAAAVNALGWDRMTPWINHGDWHPGNMLFQGHKVCVVLDFDSVRIAPRVADIANGLLQFSILRGDGAPDAWPEFFDLARMRRFLAGYLSRSPLDAAERQSLPHLMIESLIAECVIPVATTGSLGFLPGFGVLQMARRKVRWLVDRLDRIRPWLVE